MLRQRAPLFRYEKLLPSEWQVKLSRIQDHLAIMQPADEQYEARGHREDLPLSISQLNWFVKQTLEQAVPRVWVEGEVSDLSRPSSGHIYFSLKDEESQIRSVLWRSTAQRIPFELKQGQSVVCCGGVEVYPPRGTYQLIVTQIQPKGIGSLQLAFQQLHQKLTSEGLFLDRHKKQLPNYPKHIGFVTSPSGAALHDFLEATAQRWSDFRLTVIPARVQGEFAVQEIVNGIEQAQRMHPSLDVLVVGRGGGSVEDLWCFNDEAVVRAIHACNIPVVSAVGHEIDVTLSDLVADVRALTPTQAAPLVFPDREELKRRLIQQRKHLDIQLRNRLGNAAERLNRYAERSILAKPHNIHSQRRQLVDELEIRAQQAMWSNLKRQQKELAGVARALDALSPLSVLSRGFSLTVGEHSQTPLRSVSEIEVGQAIETRLADGKIYSRVESLQKKSTETT